MALPCNVISVWKKIILDMSLTNELKNNFYNGFFCKEISFGSHHKNYCLWSKWIFSIHFIVDWFKIMIYIQACPNQVTSGFIFMKY
jgi:hypothetical protein